MTLNDDHDTDDLALASAANQVPLAPQYAALLSAIPDPVILFTPAHIVLALNDAAAALLGMNAAEGAGKPLTALISSPALLAYIFEGKPLTEWSTSKQAAYAPQLTEQADGVRVLTLRDITPLKTLNRSQSEFLRILGHDLRTPLTTMKGFASMLEMGAAGELNEKQHVYVNKVLSGIEQITRLVDNIQNAGQYDPETGFYEMRRSLVDVRDIVNRIVSEQLIPADKQDLVLHVRIDDDVPVINADVTMIERALANLVDNAVKYTPNGKTVEVGVSVQKNALVFAVHDTGHGIRTADLKRLFQRHVRLERPETKRVKGVGLGLFIVKSVAYHHGGSAWVESEEGQGSTFFFSLPLQGENISNSLSGEPT
jgi:signal transduction histidine kinase